MALRGDIKTFSLSAIGRMIHEESKTGILAVTGGNQTTRIYFENGIIVFLSGNVAEDLSLGSLLKANGLIDEERLQQALQTAGAAGKRLGVVLVEQGAISKERLVRILHYQFKEAVTNMLTWQAGEFEYTDGLGDYVEDIRLTIDPIRLVAEAQKWKEFRSHIPNDRVVFQIKDGHQKLQPLESDGALRVMLLVDGQRNVNHIINETGLPRLAVYKALTSLLSQGVIVPKTKVSDQPGGGDLNRLDVVEIFLTLLDNILASMTAELGGQRARAYLVACLQEHPAYANGLDRFNPEDNLQDNLHRIGEHGARTLLGVEREALTAGFLKVVVAYLREGYQVLGFKAVCQMIERLNESLRHAAPAQQGLALKIVDFLRPYREDETLLRQPVSAQAPSRRGEAQTAREPAATRVQYLERISASTIIAFYHSIFHLLVQGLEHEIGSQGTNLFQRLVAASEAHDTLLATYNLQAGVAENVKRLHEHLSARRIKLEKEILIRTLQNLVAALLYEEKQLLGPKAARTSMAHLEETLKRIEPGKYRPLQEHLIGFLAHQKPHLGL